MKKFLLSVILFGGALSLHAQDFFADEQNKDTVSKAFYEHKYHGTLCYAIGIPNYWYGGSLLIHYNKERFSPYFEFRINPLSTINYDMLKKPTNKNLKAVDSLTASLKFRTFIVSGGMACSPIKNVLLYGNVGIRYLQSLYNKSEYEGYYIKQKDTELNIVYGGGAFYVLPFGLTAQLGVDFSKFTIITGLGFTF